MLVPHVHRALEQVRDIRERVIDRQLFGGYSGPARMAGGCVALLAAVMLSLETVPATAEAHLIGWGIACLAAFSINAGALFRWYLRRAGGKRKIEDLRPVIDSVAPLVVGGIVTWVLIGIEAFDVMCGVWMCVFGLVNIASRHALPKATWHLGWFYIACGAFYLFVWPDRSFINPWPMGIVFFLGECAGGTVFSRSRVTANTE